MKADMALLLVKVAEMIEGDDAAARASTVVGGPTNKAGVWDMEVYGVMRWHLDTYWDSARAGVSDCDASDASVEKESLIRLAAALGFVLAVY